MITIRFLLTMTLITGFLYPGLVTVLTMPIFPHQAAGSLIEKDGKVVGSELLAQKVTKPGYFLPRPSAGDYGTVASGASNFGVLNPTLKQAILDRKKALESVNPEKKEIPADLLFASGSGLDPHISPAAAYFQADRVAIERKFTADQKQKMLDLIGANIEKRTLGFLGEERVNVMLLNIKLDELK